MTIDVLNLTSCLPEGGKKISSSNRKTTITKALALVGIFGTLATFSSTAIAAQLTKEQLSNQIIGKTLTTKRMGMKVRIFYNTDGGVTVKMPLMSGKGTWKFKGDQICMIMKSGPKRGKTCLNFEHVKANKYRNSEGTILSVEN